MLINVSEVLSNDSKVLKKQATIEMECFISRLGEFPILNKTEVELTISNIGKRELSIKGSGDITLGIPCGRCLEEIETKFHIVFDKNIDLKLTDLEQVDEMYEFNYVIGNNLDVDKMIYNEILVNWPMTVLCSEDCKGICNRCGTNRNLTVCDCDTTAVDPRMAAISDIFSKFKEV